MLATTLYRNALSGSTSNSFGAFSFGGGARHTQALPCRPFGPESPPPENPHGLGSGGLRGERYGSIEAVKSIRCKGCVSLQAALERAQAELDATKAELNAFKEQRDQAREAAITQTAKLRQVEAAMKQFTLSMNNAFFPDKQPEVKTINAFGCNERRGFDPHTGHFVCESFMVPVQQVTWPPRNSYISQH